MSFASEIRDRQKEKGLIDDPKDTKTKKQPKLPDEFPKPQYGNLKGEKPADTSNTQRHFPKPEELTKELDELQRPNRKF